MKTEIEIIERTSINRIEGINYEVAKAAFQPRNLIKLVNISIPAVL